MLISQEDPVSVGIQAAERRARDWPAGPGPISLEPPFVRATCAQPESLRLLSRWPGDTGLAALLDLSLAVTPNDPPDPTFRRVASAGGRHPIVALVSSPTSDYVVYDPAQHALLSDGNLDSSRWSLLLCVVPHQTMSKYGQRSLPSILLDLGHCIGAFGCAAAALGLRMESDVLIDAHAAIQSPHETAVKESDMRNLMPLAFVHIGDSLIVEPVFRRSPSLAVTHQNASSEAGLAVVTDALLELSAGHWPPRPRRYRGQAIDISALRQRRSADVPFVGPTSFRIDLEEVAISAQRTLDEMITSSVHLSVLIADHQGLWTVLDHALVKVASGDARPVLGNWACQQTWISASILLMIVTGSFIAGPDTAPSMSWPWRAKHYRLAYVSAGAAVHTASVEATARRFDNRPVGCWGTADVGAATQRRAGQHVILHSLAIGPGRSPQREVQ